MATRLQFTTKSGLDYVNTTAFLCKAMRLSAQQDLLDKTQSVVLSSMKTLDLGFVKEIEDLFNYMEHNRMQESEQIKQQLMLLVDNLKNVKVLVCSNDKIKHLDVDSYRSNLLDLESRLTSFKETSKKEYAQLQFDENILWEQVQTMEHKLEDWNKPLRMTALRPQTRSFTKSAVLHPNANKAVMSLQKFLEGSGGQTGGWAEEDHLCFLRLRRKHRNKDIFLDSVIRELPDMTRAKISFHEDWFVQYEVLKARQRQAIEQWRTDKGKMKVGQVESEVPVEPVKASQSENKEKIAEKKHKIEEWKKYKEIQKEMEEARRKIERHKQLAEWQRKKERQEAQRILLEQYKEEKMNQHQAFVLAKQMHDMEQIESRTAQANLSLKAFREQDMEYLSRQKSRRAQKAQEQEGRQHSLYLLKQQVQVKAERNPQRLLQPTEAWRERLRMLSKEESEPSKSALHLRNMPHLGIPAWRQGLT